MEIMDGDHLSKAYEQVLQVDLSQVRNYAQKKEGWTEGYAKEVEQGYREFLSMYMVQPDGKFVATRDVDTFWHMHILHTEKYAEDCNKLFGGFFHHTPGLPDEKQDMSPYIDGFKRQVANSEAHFGGVKGVRNRFAGLSAKLSIMGVSDIQAICFGRCDGSPPKITRAERSYAPMAN